VLSPEEKLKLLARNDAEFLRWKPSAEADAAGGRALDARARALVRVAALVAMDAPASAFAHAADAAFEAGATRHELVDILIAVAPSIGVTRVVAAAPKLAAAIGYDVDAALEG
jgi:alkylhydroperoxidase/carboxymuconolactone decarboxylase family protein YurZ